ncbi:MAG: RadC family protein [Clostridia bacterium]
MKNNDFNRIDVVSLRIVKEREYKYQDENVSNPNIAAKIIKDCIGDLDRENMVVLCLSSKNQITSINFSSTGILNASLAHPREIFKTAVIANANSIILGHNHPSGEADPSGEDEKITRRIADAGDLLGIKLLDHIIVSHNEDHFSFRKEGLI